VRRLAAFATSSQALVAVAAALATALPQDAASHPKRRSGLWEVRTVGADAIGMPPTRFCVGDATDTATAHLDRAGGDRGSCTLGQFVRAGDTWVADSICREGKSTVVSRAVASGDFENEYRIDTIVTQSGGASTPRRENREAVVARWLGPCSTGQRPGDLVVPGMGTLNMDDGTFRAEPTPRARRPPAAPPPAGGPAAAPASR
jgi:hypothetical protein